MFYRFFMKNTSGLRKRERFQKLLLGSLGAQSSDPSLRLDISEQMHAQPQTQHWKKVETLTAQLRAQNKDCSSAPSTPPLPLT